MQHNVQIFERIKPLFRGPKIIKNCLKFGLNFKNQRKQIFGARIFPLGPLNKKVMG